MASVMRKPELLIVDTSPAMARALGTYAEQQDYQADIHCDPAQACDAIDNRINNRYDCVVLGWPEGSINLIGDLLARLSQADLAELPLVIVTQKNNAMIDNLAKHRDNTRTLLWKNYRRLTKLTDQLLASESSADINSAPAHSILLLSDAPAESTQLVSQIKERGHQVEHCNSVSAAKTALVSHQYDLVVADYFNGESASDLSGFLRSMDVSPVFAFMADKDLDEIVQASLALGATTCLDKTEPADQQVYRLDTIIGGLRPRSESVVKSQVTSIASSAQPEQLLVPLTGVVEMSDEPALLLTEAEGTVLIVAANRKAQNILAPQAPAALINQTPESAFGDRLDLTRAFPVEGQFVSVAGDQLKVRYFAKKLQESALGVAGVFFLVKFKVVQKANTKAPQAAKAPVVAEVSPAVQFHDSSLIEQAIDRAVAQIPSGHVVGVLMLDIKMKAAVTGDRLSLGNSTLLLDMVKEGLTKHHPKENTLAYLGEGRFALLLEVPGAEQALSFSKRVVDSVPDLVSHLGDVELISHSALLRISDQTPVTAADALRHCAQACVRTESSGRDNEITVISKEAFQQLSGAKRTDVTHYAEDSAALASAV